MMDEKVKPLPPGVARNADLTTRRYGRNPDVNHFAGSRDYEGRGDSADKWLKENDPKRRDRVNAKKQRRNRLLSEYEKERGMPKAPAADVSIGMWKSRDETSSKLTIFLADHLVKYIFRKTMSHGKVRLDMRGNLIRIVSIDAQGTGVSRGRTYTIAAMKGGKSSRFRVQISKSDESFDVGIAAAAPTAAHFVKTMLGSWPCLQIEIPAEMLTKPAPLPEQQDEPVLELNDESSQPPGYEELVGDYTTEVEETEVVQEEESVEMEEQIETDEQSDEPSEDTEVEESTEDQPLDTPEPDQPETVIVPANETDEKDAAMPATETITADTTVEETTTVDVYALLVKAKSGDYGSKLDAVVAAAQLLNEAMSDPMMNMVTLTLEDNKVGVDAPVIVRKRLV